jgi:choline dehydrogenase
MYLCGALALATVPTLSTATESQPEYEYIVVGSGAGGGTVASRLARYGHKVLLIESGDDQGANLYENVPAFHPYSTEDPRLSWGFYVKHYQDPERARRDDKMVWTTPSGELYVGKMPPQGSTMKGIWYPRSSTLGGCSSHNAMINVYPHEKDWSHIASITGDNSWSPNSMRKYYERLEDCNYLPHSLTGHGSKGWLGVSRADLGLALKDTKVPKIISDTVGVINGKLSALPNTGDALLGDLNSGDPDRDSKNGLFQIPVAVRGNKRSSVRDFIASTVNAVNTDGSRKYILDIQYHTLVTKVLFSSSSGTLPRAIGVEYLQGQSLYRADPRASSAANGTIGQAKASREVILSGGAYNSPQLLKLSGIGARKELEKHGIPVIVDLPGVGTNLQDHFEISVIEQANTDFNVVKDCTFGRGPDPCLKDWTKGKGAYLSTGFFLAAIKTSSVAEYDPDLFLFGGIAAFRGYYPGYSREVFGHRNWTWTVLKAHTENHAGTVDLVSADPRDTPDITFNYFDTGTAVNGSEHKDVQAMTEAVALARRTFKSQMDYTEVLPGSSIAEDEAIKTHIKDEAWGHHASCSNPIGAYNDPMAVLDSRFKVRGVEGLRVVDASVFPKIPGFFIAVPTYMIGEKAADVISNEAAHATV